MQRNFHIHVGDGYCIPFYRDTVIEPQNTFVFGAETFFSAAPLPTVISAPFIEEFVKAYLHCMYRLGTFSHR